MEENISEDEARGIIAELVRKAQVGPGTKPEEWNSSSPANVKRTQLLNNTLDESLSPPDFDSAGICQLYKRLLEFPFMTEVSRWRKDALSTVQAYRETYVRDHFGGGVPGVRLQLLVEQYGAYDSKVGAARARCVCEGVAVEEFTRLVREQVPANPLLNICTYHAYDILTSRVLDGRERRGAEVMWAEANEWFTQAVSNTRLCELRYKAELRLRNAGII